jgi:hypothetical protein
MEFGIEIASNKYNLYFCTFRHSRESGNPEALILLDSRFRGNDE